MKTLSQVRPAGGGLGLASLGVLVVAPVPPPAQAAGLPRFTGYPRPGAPVGPEGGAPARPVALDPNDANTPIGGTIYFRVFENARDGASRDNVSADNPDDPWNTGM